MQNITLRFLVLSSFAALSGVASVNACSAGGNHASSAAGGSGFGGDTVSTSGSAAGGKSSSQGTGGDIGIGGGIGCDAVCSADGTAIVDCHGATLMNCPSTELCASAKCEDACQAAIDSKSSVGCDYYAVDMDGFGPSVGGCFAVFVANTFAQPAHLNFDFAGSPIDLAQYAKIPQGTGKSVSYGAYDPVAGLPAGQVAIVFLSQSGGGVACPTPAATGAAAQITGTGFNKAFHFKSDVPVVGYQMLPYGGGSAAVTGASLLLPTSSWDTNYIAVNAYPESMAATSPSLDIVAAQDNTTVTILPNTAIVGGNGVTAAAANTQAKYTLMAGQVLQITQSTELTGSPIQADKPIGFWGGHQCLLVPVDKYACDHAEQQIPPVRALGSSYAGVSYRARSAVPENPPWRIIGAVDGTTLTFDPAIPGAPSSVNLGQIAEFNTYAPFTVKSQDKDHPFLLVTYMTGEENVTQFFGDADFVRIVPTTQYLNRYVFFTDPTYSETNLVVVRPKGKNGYADVQLDCAGKLGNWMNVDAAGAFQYTRIDLVTGDFQGQNGCDNGRHEMTSTDPFGLWVWGWGTPLANPSTISVSYGYPAGEGVVPLNDVVVPVVPK